MDFEASSAGAMGILLDRALSCRQRLITSRAFRIYSSCQIPAKILQPCSRELVFPCACLLMLLKCGFKQYLSVSRDPRHDYWAFMLISMAIKSGLRRQKFQMQSGFPQILEGGSCWGRLKAALGSDGNTGGRTKPRTRIPNP